MGVSTETIGRLYASGRNYINLIIGFASGVGVVNAAQQKEIMDSLGEIYNGISMIVHGGTSLWTVLAVVAAPILGPILARMASNSAKVDSQAKAISTAVKDPNTDISVEAKASMLEAVAKSVPLKEKIIVADPTLAAAVPSDKVVSK